MKTSRALAISPFGVLLTTLSLSINSFGYEVDQDISQQISQDISQTACREKIEPSCSKACLGIKVSYWGYCEKETNTHIADEYRVKTRVLKNGGTKFSKECEAEFPPKVKSCDEWEEEDTNAQEQIDQEGCVEKALLKGEVAVEKYDTVFSKCVTADVEQCDTHVFEFKESLLTKEKYEWPEFTEQLDSSCVRITDPSQWSQDSQIQFELEYIQAYIEKFLQEESAKPLVIGGDLCENDCQDSCDTNCQDGSFEQQPGQELQEDDNGQDEDSYEQNRQMFDQFDYSDSNSN